MTVSKIARISTNRGFFRNNLCRPLWSVILQKIDPHGALFLISTPLRAPQRVSRDFPFVNHCGLSPIKIDPHGALFPISTPLRAPQRVSVQSIRKNRSPHTFFRKTGFVTGTTQSYFQFSQEHTRWIPKRHWSHI